MNNGTSNSPDSYTYKIKPIYTGTGTFVCMEGYDCMNEIMAVGYIHGYKILYVNNQWVFEDTNEPIYERKCKYCNNQPVNGHDYCIANLPNVKHACCGHGIQNPYIVLNTDEYIKFKNKDELYRYFNIKKE